jgi:hypothetical protein
MRAGGGRVCAPRRAGYGRALAGDAGGWVRFEPCNARHTAPYTGDQAFLMFNAQARARALFSCCPVYVMEVWVEGARATCTALPSCHHSMRVTPQPPYSLTMSPKAPPSSSESPAPCSLCSRRPREQRVAPYALLPAWAGGLAGRHAPHCASGQRTSSAVAGRLATLVTTSPTDPELPSPRRLRIGRSVSGNHPIFTIMILRHRIGLHHRLI